MTYVVAISVDTPERARYCCTTNPGGSTYYGCFRCLARGRELLLWSYEPYDNLRSRGHYTKILAELRKENRLITKSNFSSKTGYSTFNYFKSQLCNVANIHTATVVDIDHNSLNIFKQNDKAVKKNHLDSDTQVNI